MISLVYLQYLQFERKSFHKEFRQMVFLLFELSCVALSFQLERKPCHKGCTHMEFLLCESCGVYLGVLSEKMCFSHRLHIQVFSLGKYLITQCANISLKPLVRLLR